MKALIPLALLVMVASGASAAPSKTVYSIGTDFTSSSNWSLTEGGSSCSCTPDFSKDEIFIQHDMTYTGDLEFGSQVSVSIESATFNIYGDVEFKNGSDVTVDGTSVFNVYGDVVNDNESDEIVVDGAFNVYQDNGSGGSYTGQRGSTVTGGGTLITIGNLITLDPGGPGNPGMVFGSTDDCTTGFCSASNGGVVLPVELSSLSQAASKNGIVLSWTTASESNNDYFTLEGSVDGINFEFVDEIPGQGSTSASTEYVFTAQAGFTYFRLSQTDYNGQRKQLKTIAVSEQMGNVVLESNTCHSNCLVNINRATEVVLMDISGRTLVNSIMEGQVDLSPWMDHAGVYFMTADNKSERLVYLNK